MTKRSKVESSALDRDQMTSQTGDGTRTALLRSAAEVFARDGFHRASLAEVAAAAGFTTGAVYSNFKSKDDLFLAVIEDRLDQRLAEVKTTSASPVTTPSQVEELGRLISKYIQDDWAFLYLEFVLYALRNDTARPRLMASARRTRELVTDVITAQIDAMGVVETASPLRIATLATALFQGLALERLVDPDAVGDETLDDTLKILLNALRSSDFTLPPSAPS